MKPIVEIQPSEVKERLESGESLVMIDVREPHEYVSGHIPGAVSVPMGTIPDELDRISKDREVIFICRSGNRSSHVCAYLQEQGFENVLNMADGMLSWDGEVTFGDK